MNIVIERPEKEIKSWEEYLSLGMEARETKDSCSWILGDLVGSITTDYGEDTVGKYAYAIGMERKTLMNYRTIASTFNPEIREKYKKLSFSHFGLLTSLKVPEAWLEKADDEEWTVETLRHNLREAREDGPSLIDKPPQVYGCPECGLWRLKDISSYEVCKGHYTITKEGDTVYK